MKKKNPAAVALGLKSARSRMKNKSAEQRQEQARAASQARWAKAKPKPAPEKFWCLSDITDPDYPRVLFSSKDKNEVQQAQHRPEFRDRVLSIGFLEYDPSRIVIEREFKPDTKAQVKALNALLGAATVTEEGSPS
jgi:hypothetical protein